jgi:ABC transporter with metal-binding/Fe-S-binding domain ATP-binding protein
MKVAALFSGGKDSIFAIYIAQQYGWDITHLISIFPENKDSWMYHSVNIHLTKTLAKALDIPLISQKTKGKKEEELLSLKELLSTIDIDGIISGAIASEYQRTRIEQVCHNLKIKSFTPLWHKDQSLLLKDMIQAGFNIKIVGIFADGFNENWLGKTIDTKTFEQLIQIQQSKKINIAGEGGEYETLVVDGPIFKQKILLKNVEKRWKRDHGKLFVKQTELEEKQHD